MLLGAMGIAAVQSLWSAVPKNRVQEQAANTPAPVVPSPQPSGQPPPASPVPTPKTEATLIAPPGLPLPAPALPGMPPAAGPVGPAPALDLAPAPAVAASERLEEHLKASKSPDAGVRRKAASALGTFLTHPNEVVRRKASKALAQMGADAAAAEAALEAAAKDADEEVRQSSGRALDNLNDTVIAKAIKTRETLFALAKELKAKEPEDRIKALYKIAAFGSDANVVGEQIIEAMQDKVNAVQSAASETLERVNPMVHPHVVAILRGKNKREAIHALGELGGEAVIAVPLVLYCNDNIFFWGGANPKAGQFYEDLFPVIAKIAPKDKRFSATVLASVSAPNTKRDRTLRDRRIAAIAQLAVIDASTADKVAALVAALEDGEGAIQAITALEEYGADAKPAIPALKKLKTAPNPATRDAAITAIAKIELASSPP